VRNILTFTVFLVLILCFNACQLGNEKQNKAQSGDSEIISFGIDGLEFTNGYPTDETSQMLYDEMDLQRATQAYIWGFPLVSSASIRRGLFEDLGRSYYDIILYENLLDAKSIWFTGN
jgi:hypothetical protein